MGNGDWGLGIVDWGLGPIPNPQSPIPIQISLIFSSNLINFNLKNNINAITLIKTYNNYESDFIKKFGSILYLVKNLLYHFSKKLTGTANNCLL